MSALKIWRVVRQFGPTFTPSTERAYRVESIGVMTESQAVALARSLEADDLRAELANMKALLGAVVEDRRCREALQLDPIQAAVVPCGACMGCQVSVALGRKPFTYSCGETDPPDADALRAAAVRYDEALELIADTPPAGGYLVGNRPLLEVRLLGAAKHLRALAEKREATS